MRQAESSYPGQPFRIITDLGEVVFLPPELGDEIRNEPRLSFSAAVAIVGLSPSCAAFLAVKCLFKLTFYLSGLPFQCSSVWVNQAERDRRSDHAAHRTGAID